MKHIEHIFVGEDIQIQIDNENPEWFDEHGKLLIEDIDAYLQDKGLIEDTFEVYRDTNDDVNYSFTDDDIQSLKSNGIGRMYKL